MAANTMFYIRAVYILFCYRLLSVRGNYCGEPPKIDYGQVRNGTSNGTVTAYYSCNKGFVNIGRSQLSCLSSGKWEKKKIKCVHTCPPPPLPLNAVIHHSSIPKVKYAKGSRIFYRCKPGYRLAGLVFIYCLGQQWTEVKFACVVSKECNRPEIPVHGERIGNHFAVGKRVFYMCDNGFALHGAMMLECLKNRTWSGEVPVCKVVDCGSLPDPLHGKKTLQTKTTFRGRTEFKCTSRHFSLTGSKRRFCLASGQWSGKPVVCKAPCKNPGVPKNGQQIGKNFRHGKEVSFRCKKSHKMIGPRRITCHDGHWSNRRPRCLLPSQVKDYSECGLRSKIRRSRMVGGLPSAHGMWPWQAGLYRLDQRTGKEMFICGGALIDRQWIVTAAHCFMHRDPDDNVRLPLISQPNIYKVALGDSHRNKTEKSQHAFLVNTIIMHPRYHDQFKENDIALVKLSSRVTLGRFVRKVCLPEKVNNSLHQHTLTPGSKGHVAGWGATQVLNPGEVDTRDPQKSSSLELLSAQFQIKDIERCRNSTDYHFNDSISFCAGSNKSGVGICKGDSGGPFVMNIMHGDVLKWVAVGLVSWGEGCGIYGRYTFYTKLAPYVEWINQQKGK